MLEIKDICLGYGAQLVLSHFNLIVKDGQVACISGESGRGKTSLLNAIMGFVPLLSGSISLDGIILSPRTIDQIRSRIAWLPQELSLPSEWVKEMVLLPFSLKSNRKVRFSEDALMECFDALGLEHELYDKRVNEISGGQRQRIMIAVASLLDKSLYIADEPTSALDAISAGKVISFFHRMADKGRAVLIVSHDSVMTQNSDLLITL